MLVGAQLLPGLIAKVSDSKVVVRKAASQALSGYLSATRDKASAFNTLVRSGLEAQDWRQRQATLLFLSLPTTPLGTSAPCQRELIRSIVAATLDPIDTVATAAQQETCAAPPASRARRRDARAPAVVRRRSSARARTCPTSSRTSARSRPLYARRTNSSSRGASTKKTAAAA